MKLSTVTRILIDRYWNPKFRQTYWQLAVFAKEAQTLFFHPDPSLRRHVRSDLMRYFFGGAKPVAGESEERAHAAVDWLLRAQLATPDGGVSLGYFPADLVYQGWLPSYPETTGYIMTSLLLYARRFNNASVRDAAITMGKWEIAVQMPSGAVQGGPVTSPDRQRPAAFNTGMVLDGWCSAYQETHDPAFLGAARKAANFLLNDIGQDGYYKTNGDYVSVGEIKTYTCLCAWALYRFGELSEDRSYCEGALRSIEAAVRQQHSNGWFAHNCLSRSEAPLTHTIGYTLQGILEVGLLSGREDFITAVRRGIDPIMERIASDGYLPSRFYADWEPASFSSCLTGNAQVALVCFRLSEVTGETRYATSANQLVDFLKSLQARDLPNTALNGAIAGSFPLLGEYMRSGYPNWATKYFLDALLMQSAV
jgi:hypothetical protein